MKILVTGGAGFIGSNLVEALVEKDHGVAVLDDFSKGSMENLDAVKNEIEVVSGDIRDFQTVKKATKDIDIVFNQAAASSSPMFLQDLRSAVSVNVDGFINLLNACRINGVKKLIYASTSSIYGNNKPPLQEDMQVWPVNFYSTTKLLNEHFAMLFGREYGLETIGFRYMSIYGPHEKSKGVFANMASQFLWVMQRNEQPVVYGNGAQTREFTYVADVVDANLLAMNSKENLSGEVFNVGTGKSTSLNELVAIINTLLGKNIKPEYVTNTAKNYIHMQLSDISKIKKVLGYEPEYDLEQGLKKTIERGAM
ncbi:MAG: SDR family NAD(P)-dependent oxidoreductase [Candidatus Aenigmarchaeota archaeon]|nr:SDR family NAD(P)-dependent oxidoreductase [Candidatus Aenigmarchaeota archaeon]